MDQHKYDVTFGKFVPTGADVTHSSAFPVDLPPVSDTGPVTKVRSPYNMWSWV